MKVIKKYDGLPCETSIIEEDEDGIKCLLLECKINNKSYAFNVDWVKESSRETKEDQLDWLARVYSSDLMKSYKNGRQDIKNEVNSNIKNIKDLFD